MTREEMTKRSWKGYMVILYQEKRMPEPIECLLLEIDFEAEIMTLCPIDEHYQNKDFPANIKYCSVPEKVTELKIVKR